MDAAWQSIVSSCAIQTSSRETAAAPSSAFAVRERWLRRCERCVPLRPRAAAPRGPRGLNRFTPALTPSRYFRCVRSDFRAAWEHVSKMGSGDAVRDGYATYLIMVDASFPRHTLDALCNDVAQVTRVGRSEEGQRVFGEQFKAVEGACRVSPRAELDFVGRARIHRRAVALGFAEETRPPPS
jgi:hypothetical protein